MGKKKNTSENTSVRVENASIDAAAANYPPEKSAVQRSEIAPEREADIFRGLYKALCPVNMRSQPDGLPILTELPKGCIVECEGGYTMSRGVRWLYVEAESNGKRYAGFCSVRFLARV